ncbi:Hpt domain-containing protein [Dokdonella sp.]|uniref:Hpt domain-containing protein n=1 Tax=Dokdonella sp. TaxID=2291710 RepID=UPI0025C59F65|nr:Hpt domain-containing protein [Dokdonella sp.]MBX3687939.1 Hpt domain-containing protein [Dokdonella sp.]
MLMVWNRTLTGNDPQIEALCRRYIASLGDKRAALESAWRGCRPDGDRDAGLRELAALAHRLAGSAGSYGFDELGLQARNVDRIASNLLANAAHPDGRHLAHEVATLFAAIDSARSQR